VQDPKAVTARLAIVGAPLFNDDHLYEAKLKTRIRELNLTSITLTGARADVPAILRAADLSVLNASVEPFGLVLLESISSGTPVLATLTGGIPEIIAPDTGVLVPPPGHPLNATELTRAFQDALAHPESSAERATNAFNEVLPQFTLAVFAANLQALYTSLTL
jgi:glycosyltransferase involved in cell wall biosynthesis